MRKKLILLSTLLSLACGEGQPLNTPDQKPDSGIASEVVDSGIAVAPLKESPYLCAIDEAHPAQTKTHSSVVSSNPQKANFSAASAPRKHRQNELKDGILTIYFLTNGWTMHDNDYQDLRNFLRSLAPDTNLILEGYADLRGSEEFNLELGRKRAGGIEELLRSSPKVGKVEMISYGESKPVNTGKDFTSLQANRRVRLVPDKTVIARGFDLLSSDYYLVDQSASMNNPVKEQLSKWQEVQGYRFPKGAEIYAFSTQVNPCTGDLSKTFPRGETPLFTATYDLITRMPAGKSLTVLTDGCNNYGTTSPKEIIDLAKSKGVKVSFIALDSCNRADLENIAGNTGGRTYIPY
jgi:outer membrane protein OmpA-like peptidoglycan-associated protein